MKRLISSIFIFLLFLLCLWSFTTWFYGNKINNDIQQFLSNQTHKNEYPFQIQLHQYSSTLFRAKASISISLNKNHAIYHRLGLEELSLPQKIPYTVIINNGPLLFDNGSISVGHSKWTFSQNAEEINRAGIDHISNVLVNHLDGLTIHIATDKNVNYRLPLLLHSVEKQLSQHLLLTGQYNPQSRTHSGQLHSDELRLTTNQQQIKANGFNLDYTIDKKDQLHLQSSIDKLLLHSSDLNVKILTTFHSRSILSLDKNELNSQHSILLKELSASEFTIDQVDLSLTTDSINIVDINLLYQSLNTIVNQHQQRLWVLEEQGEFPEGIAQAWQIQNDNNRQYKQLNVQFKQLLAQSPKTKGKNSIRFSMNANHNQQISSLSGSVLAIGSPRSLATIVNPSILSLIQAHSRAKAEVSLQEGLFRELAQTLALDKPHFEISYENAQLLMH